METVTIPSGNYQLGWRHTLPADAQAAIEGFVLMEEYVRASFSPARSVELDEFEICTNPMSVGDRGRA